MLPGLLRDPGLPGSGGWQPGWKHANDPLIPSRDIGPLTHASAGDPSGAASNMPSQLFDSTHNLWPSLSVLGTAAFSPSSFLSFARLSSSSSSATFNRTSLRLSRFFFPVYPTRPLYLWLRGASCSCFFCFFVLSLRTPIPVPLSVVFPSLSLSAVHFISFAIVISVSPKFRAGVLCPVRHRFALEFRGTT